MIAAWMFYCALCALGLAVAGVLAERLLLAGCAPVRLVWVGALLTSLALPVIVFRVSSSAARVAAPTRVAMPIADEALTATPVNVAAARFVETPSAPAPRDWQRLLPALDKPLLFAWIALSAAMTLSFGGGFLALAWMRRTWQRRDVQGLSVYVSHRTGPAVVGALAPSIVVPEWALALPQDQLGLMLRHEQEHLRARDGQLILAAQLALIAMPWNLALWWQVLSLRVAVEMDCDARVLRHANPRTYGELLLEVARPHRGLNLAGMIAFAERATQLERRIRVLKRHRSATSLHKAVAAAGIALLATTAAWVAPHPAVPPATARYVAPATAPTISTSHRAMTAAVVSPRVAVASVLRKPAARAVVQTPALIDCASDTSLVGAVYRSLFDGITLSRDNESKACAVLARLADEQLAEDAVSQASVLESRRQRTAIQLNRNATLAAMLHSDSERAAFAANSSRASAGGIIKMGAAPGGTYTMLPNGTEPPNAVGGFVTARPIERVPLTAAAQSDSVAVARGAGMLRENLLTDATRAQTERQAAMATAGAARNGVIGGTITATASGAMMRRAATDSQAAEPAAAERLANQMRDRIATLNAATVEATYRRLFEGITLSADEESLARKVLTEAQQASGAVASPIRPGTRLRLIPARGMAQVVAGADSELLSVVPGEADRAKLRARLIAVPQQQQ